MFLLAFQENAVQNFRDNSDEVFAKKENAITNTINKTIFGTKLTIYSHVESFSWITSIFFILQKKKNGETKYKIFIPPKSQMKKVIYLDYI